MSRKRRTLSLDGNLLNPQTGEGKKYREEFIYKSS
ncbi:hypothetical protein BIW11_05035 [Tropilaelaps mercedesae]|uniref:Uncharacterized protein n=1 Tax=Tropilaelaps mercedesae TaxID=418985 RepID=A0A1V9WYK6_9ACAR|nr:hypothetical protein BIW11_05035 [Tropilaelaps mercedesae]